jgi:hypothetical protein
MASQNTDDATAGADRITFELEHLGMDSGRLLVSGRWYGVRGRRFVRPTLILRVRADGSERRALADLDHKPWAAQDGELWIAAFRIPVALEETAELELSVAPDVAVELTEAQATARGRRARTSRAADARAPRIRTDPVPARPSAQDREQEIDRLRIRLTEAQRAYEREQAKRQAADQALEDERSEALRLRSEVGSLRAELDLAATVRTELDATAAELDATRRESRESGERLQSTIRALDQQRAEAEQLQMRLTASEATVERITQARETEERMAAEERREAEERRAAEQRRAVEEQRQAREEQTRRQTRERSAARVSRDEPTRRPPSEERTRRLAREGKTERQPGGDETAKLPAQPTEGKRPDAAYPRPDRPLNPSLRSRRWLGRIVALIVMIGVIAAIVIVIHSAMPSLL